MSLLLKPKAQLSLQKCGAMKKAQEAQEYENERRLTKQCHGYRKD